MRILVVGGTSFIGRAITAAALDAGHEVTLFNRGRTSPRAFAGVERLVGDRDVDLSALADDRAWDATVDVCAYVPRQVRTLLETLGERAGHYTFVSTVSVYPDDVRRGYDEDVPLREPAWDNTLDMAKYGALKVGCEQVAHELAGDRLLAIRPTYVIGPHDPTHRFVYWVERLAEQRSPMACPDLDQPLQLVDARDLAAFTVGRTADRLTGAVHLVGPRRQLVFGEVFERMAKALDVALPELQPVDDERLPFLDPDPATWALMTADPARSEQLGMTWRPLKRSTLDTLEWVRRARDAGTYRPRRGSGLTAKQEQALLADR